MSGRGFSRTAPARALPRCAGLVPRPRLPGPRRRPLPLAGPACRPRRAVGEPSWGGSPSPVAPAPLDVSSILAADRIGSPQGPGSRSCLLPALPGGHRRSAPGLLLLLIKPDPPHEPWGRELVLGETPPPRLEEDVFTHIQLLVASRIHHLPNLPRLPNIYFYGPWRQEALRAKRSPVPS